MSEVASSTVASSKFASSKFVLPGQFWLAVILVVVLDQVSKLWVRSALPVGLSQPLIENWIHFTHSQNTGAAWSMMSGQRWLLVCISIVVGAFVLWTAREFARESGNRVLPLLALGLIFGGAVGNLIDRILFGVVTDFFDLDTPISYLRTFPIFNVADCALTIGVFLLMLHFLLQRETDSQSQNKNPKINASDSL